MILKFSMKFFSIFLLLLILSCQDKKENITIDKPNILFIMTDDQGWYDVGFNGNTEILTPHIDALANTGIIFKRFYSASPVCSPTRASVLTGRNPLRMNIPNANRGHMLPEEYTLPELLQSYGYRTGHFGKWHLGTFSTTLIDANRGGRPEFVDDYALPNQHGYDVYFSTESKVPTYDPMIRPSIFDEEESLRFGWKALLPNDSSTNYGTAYWHTDNNIVTENLKGDDSRVIMDRVIPFIEQSKASNQPFFTTLWFHTPHLPVVVDSLHRNLYPNQTLAKQLYYGTISALDDQIGRLWEKLEELNIADNTIIFYCSDNGPERDTPGSPNTFRARKRSLYEGGVRVPAFVVWKNQFKNNQVTDFPAVTSDYLPTILDILEIPYPDNRPIDGISLLSVLTSMDTRDRKKPIGFIYQNRISWVNHQYKLIGDLNKENFELYDLINDPTESHNLVTERTVLADSLRTEIMNWLASVESSSQGKDY